MIREKDDNWTEINVIVILMAITMVVNVEGSTVPTQGNTEPKPNKDMACRSLWSVTSPPGPEPDIEVYRFTSRDECDAFYEKRYMWVRVTTEESTTVNYNTGIPQPAPRTKSKIPTKKPPPRYPPGNPRDFRAEWNDAKREVVLSWLPPTENFYELKGFLVEINATEDDQGYWCFYALQPGPGGMANDTTVLCELTVPWYNVPFNISLDHIRLRSMPSPPDNMGVTAPSVVKVVAKAPVTAESICVDMKGIVTVQWFQAAFSEESSGHFPEFLITITKTTDMTKIKSDVVKHDREITQHSKIFEDLEDGYYLAWVNASASTNGNSTDIVKNANFKVACMDKDRIDTSHTTPVPTNGSSSSTIPTSSVPRFVAAAPLAILSYFYV